MRCFVKNGSGPSRVTRCLGPHADTGSKQTRHNNHVQSLKEVGGRWSVDALTTLKLLAAARARSAPQLLRGQLSAALCARWSAMVSMAVQDATASTLTGAGCGALHTSLLGRCRLGARSATTSERVGARGRWVSSAGAPWARKGSMRVHG